MVRGGAGIQGQDSRVAQLIRAADLPGQHRGTRRLATRFAAAGPKPFVTPANGGTRLASIVIPHRREFISANYAALVTSPNVQGVRIRGDDGRGEHKPPNANDAAKPRRPSGVKPGPPFGLFRFSVAKPAPHVHPS
jgi:hypothetical protein